MTWRRVGITIVVVLIAAMGVGVVGFSAPWADGGDGPADAPEQQPGSPNATEGGGADDASPTSSPTPTDGTPTQTPTATATSSSSSGGGGGGGSSGGGGGGSGSGGGSGGSGGGGGGADDGSDETAMAAGSTTVAPGANDTVALTLETAPDGMSGFRTTVSVDTGVATIDAASIAEDFERISSVAVAEDGSAATIEGVDTGRTVGVGATDVRLGTLTVTGVENGSTALSVTSERFDDEDGDAVAPATTNGTVTVESSSGSDQ